MLFYSPAVLRVPMNSVKRKVLQKVSLKINMIDGVWLGVFLSFQQISSVLCFIIALRFDLACSDEKLDDLYNIM